MYPQAGPCCRVSAEFLPCCEPLPSLLLSISFSSKVFEAATLPEAIYSFVNNGLGINVKPRSDAHDPRFQSYPQSTRTQWPNSYGEEVTLGELSTILPEKT